MTVTYNLLNKPQRVDFGGGNYIDYIYDAAGTKHQKKVYTAGSLTTTVEYVGSISYKNGNFDYLLTGVSRITKPGSSYVYEYNLKDHLGNTRVSFQANTNGTCSVIQRADYYGFGKRFAGYTNNDNKFLYNGKEMQDEFGLNWYDYGFRYYDPEICRFISVDPLAPKFPYMTPYQYASNTPIQAVDLDGLEAAYIGDVKKQQIMAAYTKDWVTLWQFNTTGGVHKTAMEIDGIAENGRLLGILSMANKYGVKQTGWGFYIANAFKKTVDVQYNSTIVGASDAHKYDDIGGTFRHFAWQTLTTAMLGPDFAKDAGFFHEREKMPANPQDMWVDLLNNDYARQYAIDNNINANQVLGSIDSYTVFLNKLSLHILNSIDDFKNDPKLSDYLTGSKPLFLKSDPAVRNSYFTLESVQEQINSVSDEDQLYN